MKVTLGEFDILTCMQNFLVLSDSKYSFKTYPAKLKERWVVGDAKLTIK